MATERPSRADEDEVPENMLRLAFGNPEIAKVLNAGLRRLAESTDDEQLRRKVEKIQAGELSPRSLLADQEFINRASANIEQYKRQAAEVSDEERKQLQEHAQELGRDLYNRMPAAQFPQIDLSVFGYDESGRPIEPTTPNGMPDGVAMWEEFHRDADGESRPE